MTVNIIMLKTCSSLIEIDLRQTAPYGELFLIPTST